jgi:hypothetical protein
MRSIVLLLVVIIGAVMAACSGNGGSRSSVTPSPFSSPSTITPVATASPTPQPSSLGTPNLSVFDQPGFRDFAAALQAAVRSNDTQFFFDNAHFQRFDCSTPNGQTPAPGVCYGMGLPPPGPGFPVGAWASEGGVLTEAQYATMIEDEMSASRAAGEVPYALGKAVRGFDESDSGIDLAVQDVAFTGQTQSPEMLLVFRVDLVDGEWRIVEAAHGVLSILPDYFDWWVSWQQIFPGEVHPA